MRTINDYIDAAKRRNDLRSDVELGRRLNLGNSMISLYRSGRSIPADDTMIELAEMAGVDIGHALIELNIWRAKSEKVRAAYIAARRFLGSTVGLVLTLILLWPQPANAAGTNERDGFRNYILCDL